MRQLRKMCIPMPPQIRSEPPDGGREIILCCFWKWFYVFDEWDGVDAHCLKSE